VFCREGWSALLQASPRIRQDPARGECCWDSLRTLIPSMMPCSQPIRSLGASSARLASPPFAAKGQQPILGQKAHTCLERLRYAIRCRPAGTPGGRSMTTGKPIVRANSGLASAAPTFTQGPASTATRQGHQDFVVVTGSTPRSQERRHAVISFAALREGCHEA
jgi:hypothetical protein